MLGKELNLLWSVVTKKSNIAIILLSVILMDLMGNSVYRLSVMANNKEEIPEAKFEYVETMVVQDNYKESLEYTDVTIEYESNEITREPEITYDFELTGYIDVNTELNVREKPTRESDIISKLTWMNKIEYSIVDDEWCCIKMEDETIGYIASKYITDTLETYNDIYNVSGDRCKTYMDYRTITDRSSKQYALQMRATTNEENGLRMLRNRYMIAIGSYFGCTVGQYVDVVLSDNTVLHCIIGDAKQDIHTDSSNMHGLSGDTAEFIVDEKVLKLKTDVVGNISDVSDEFDNKVVEIRVYDHIEK